MTKWRSGERYQHLQSICLVSISRTLQQTKTRTIATSFDTNQSHTFILDEIVEGTDGVTATTDTSDNRIGKLANLFKQLLLDFSTDNSLVVSHNGGERMRTDGGSDTVVGVCKVSDPVSHSLVDGILKCLGTGGDGNDLEQNTCSAQPQESHQIGETHLGTKHVDSENVQSLTTNIFGTHVDDTFETESGTGGCCGDTVLTGTGFGDDSGLAESSSEENL